MGMEHHSSDKVVGEAFSSRYIPLPREELGLFGIFHSYNDRQLGVVYPPSLPVNVWLHGCKPGIA
jgi:hypothetical protein